MSILDRIETTKTTAELPPIKWMILGPAKTGKSTYATSWPKPLVLDLPAERGVWHIPGIERLPVNTWADLEEIAKALRSAPGRYQTVVIDTVDALWSLAHADFNEGAKLKIQDYPSLYAGILAILDQINSIGLHVVLVSHVKALTKEVYDEAAKKRVKVVDRYVNMLPGQLSQRVAGMMDQILHTGISQDDNYIVRCTNTSLHEAGGRVKGLPAQVTVKLGESLFKAIDTAYRTTVKPTNGTKNTAAANPIKSRLKEWGCTGGTVAPWLKLRGVDGPVETASLEVLAELDKLTADKDVAILAFDEARAEIAIRAQEQAST